MDLPSFKVVKEEKSTKVADKNQNVSTMDFHVKVEVENEADGQTDWCLQDRGSDEKYCDVVGYKALKEYCYQRCLLCYRLFPNSFNLLQHNLCHLEIPLTVPNLYQCDHCLVYFTEKAELTRHINEKHESDIKLSGPTAKMLHQCKICLKTFTYKNWHEHNLNIHNNDKLKCFICDKVFKCQRYVKRHVLYHHSGKKRPNARNERSLQCNECPKVFKTPDCLYQHKRNCHKETEPVECHLCKSKLKSKTYLNAHMRRVHYNDGKVHRCGICSKQFKSPRYVKIHMKNVHERYHEKAIVKGSMESQNKCEWCGKLYKNQVRLQIHSEKCGSVYVLKEIKVD